MIPYMQRRHFLMGAAAAQAVVMGGFSRNASAQARGGSGRLAMNGPLDRGTPAAVSAAKLARISIMDYNFESRLKLEGKPPSPDRVLDLFDIPQYYADTYGVHNVEMQHYHFPSTETAYLNEFRAHMEKVKSQTTQINVEFSQLNVSVEDPSQRYEAIDLTAKWVDHAVTLKCPRVMINQGTLTPETKEHVIAGMKVMGEYAKTKGVKISIEGRGGARPVSDTGRGRGDNASPAPAVATTPASGMPASSPGGPPAWELYKEVIEQSGCYSNLDIGNVRAPDQASLHMIIKALMPTNSGNMHIKLSPNWDLGTAIRYTNSELGYKGLYSIEVNQTQIRSVYETILANI